MRVDLVPLDNPDRCYQQVLANAVRSAKLPLVIKSYLANHTPEDAALRGVYAPAHLATN